MWRGQGVRACSSGTKGPSLQQSGRSLLLLQLLGAGRQVVRPAPKILRLMKQLKMTHPLGQWARQLTMMTTTAGTAANILQHSPTPVHAYIRDT